MTNSHNVPFFGKDQALIIITKSLTDNIHLNFIRKIGNKFQKLKDGLHLQLSIEEVCKIGYFLNSNEVNSISIIHKHPDSNKEKNFLFEKDRFDKSLFKKGLWVKGKYKDAPQKEWFSKPLIDEECRLFIKLWEHLEMEKVANYRRISGKKI